MLKVNSERPCPICSGHDRMQRGSGRRCFGFVSDDGAWAHCSREDHAGGLPLHSASNTYAHKLSGECRCGRSHGGSASVQSIGEARGAVIVATYDYTDERGEVLFQVVRKHPKTFQQRKPDGSGGWVYKLEGVRRVIYRLPEVLEAVAAGDEIWIAEGEKDVEALRRQPLVATCNAGGAGKWSDAYSRWLEGADVVIVRDRDEAGLEHARQVFASVRGVAKSVRVVEARTGKDAHDHFAAGHGVEDFTPVWPLGDLRDRDPVEWKRVVLRSSLDAGEPYRVVKYSDAMQMPDDPTWPTGLEGGGENLPNFRGVTILAGAPGAAKSYLAIASSVQATYAGWDVLYLASEMGEKGVAKRVGAYCAKAPPDAWKLILVDFGADLDSLIQLVAEHVSERKTLIVMDSISSFVDQAKANPSDQDPHQIGMLKRLIMWSLNVKRRTEGNVSFMVLSELNREGKTKGRFGDHKADLVVALETDEKQPLLKEIRVVKGWEYQLGTVGLFRLSPSNATLTRVE